MKARFKKTRCRAISCRKRTRWNAQIEGIGIRLCPVHRSVTALSQLKPHEPPAEES